MLYTPMTKAAMRLCFEAHKDQMDKSGVPYAFHPIHVAEQMSTEEETCVALLHDVIEDTPLGVNDLRAAGMSEPVVQALLLITHAKEVPYLDYVANLAPNPIARKVKLADLRHNSDKTRTDTVTERDLERLEKYDRAREILFAYERKPVPGGLYGAVVGDIAGSKYEWDSIKTKEFPLVSRGCRFTDDTAMTMAVAQALMVERNDLDAFRRELVASMQRVGRAYPRAGYGGRFRKWLTDPDPRPYNSFGNGSAMRVSPCGLAADSLEHALALGEASADVTHNHPEGIKGAQATAGCVFLARAGATKAEIAEFVRNRFYALDVPLDVVRPGYGFDVSCQGSVPQAIQAFLESESYADAVREAVSLGGDSDTQAAIAGGIAWAYYSVGAGAPAGAASHGQPAWCAQLLADWNIDAMLPDEFVDTIQYFDAICQ